MLYVAMGVVTGISAIIMLASGIGYIYHETT
jgi:hypothetical protein